MELRVYALFVLARIASGRNEDGTVMDVDAVHKLSRFAVDALLQAGEAPLGTLHYMQTGKLPHPYAATQTVN